MTALARGDPRAQPKSSVGSEQDYKAVQSLGDALKGGSVTFSDELVDCRSAWKMAIS